MELLVALAVGMMTATGVYLLLRKRSFPVILGTMMLTYAVNLFLFSMGRLAVNRPPVIQVGGNGYTDPVPQALVLTAIVISFGTTAVIVTLALRTFLEAATDHVDLAGTTEKDSAES